MNSMMSQIKPQLSLSKKEIECGILITLYQSEPNKKFIIKPVVSDSSILSFIREQTSCENPNARFIRRRYPDYPLRQYEISPIGVFSAPFIYKVLSACKEFSIPVSFSTDVKKYLVPFWNVLPNKKWNGDIEETLNLQYRHYQKEAIKRALTVGRGLIKIPTAGGKTLVMAGIYSFLRDYLGPNQFVLFLFPNTHLAYQTAQSFVEYGIDEKEIRVWTGEEGKPEQLEDFRGALIVNAQILLRQKKVSFKEIQQVPIFFCDEVHTLRRANKISKWLMRNLHANYRFGFTGTFPPEETEMLFLQSLIGPPIYSISLPELEREKFTVPFVVKEHPFRSPPTCPWEIKKGYGRKEKNSSSSTGLDFYQAEIEYLINCPERNAFIGELVKNLGEACSLVLVDRIEHGKAITDLIKKVLPEWPVYFISGERSVQERKQIMDSISKEGKGVIVAISRIFSIGINFPALQHIVFASPFKAKIKLLQSIGRVLRLYPGKELVQVHDIIDDTYYSYNHYISRKQIIREVTDQEDFSDERS